MAQFVNQMILDRGIKPPKTGRFSLRVKHCPGLYLEVTATGHMAWKVMYRAAGKQVKETHALCPVDEAVAWARELHDRARGGGKPLAERRSATDRAARSTLAIAVERWLQVCERDLKPKTAGGYRQIFSHDILPRWGDRPLASISKADILALLNDKAARRDRVRRNAPAGAGVQTNRVLTRLKTFFGWAIANDLLAVDPTAGVRKPVKERARDRVLSDPELCAFWTATEDLGAKRRTAPAIGALLRMLLLTAQRENEVADLRWAEIDLDRKTWTIPSARTKNSKAHVVHLSEPALAIIEALPRLGPMVFSTTAKPISFARHKRRLDELMGGGEPFVLHDLRRTATSCMARLDIAPHVVDRVLNHTAGTIRGVALVYNRHEYINERQLALAGLGRLIGLLVQDHVPGHVAEARIRLWLRSERERGEREAAGNVVDFPQATTA